MIDCGFGVHEDTTEVCGERFLRGTDPLPGVVCAGILVATSVALCLQKPIGSARGWHSAADHESPDQSFGG